MSNAPKTISREDVFIWKYIFFLDEDKGRHCSIVWRYRIGYFWITCQTAAGWTECVRMLSFRILWAPCRHLTSLLISLCQFVWWIQSEMLSVAPLRKLTSAWHQNLTKYSLRNGAFSELFLTRVTSCYLWCYSQEPKTHLSPTDVERTAKQVFSLCRALASVLFNKYDTFKTGAVTVSNCSIFGRLQPPVKSAFLSVCRPVS